jgi:hypothetical protein
MLSVTAVIWYLHQWRSSPIPPNANVYATLDFGDVEVDRVKLNESLVAELRWATTGRGRTTPNRDWNEVHWIPEGYFHVDEKFLILLGSDELLLEDFPEKGLTTYWKSGAIDALIRDIQNLARTQITPTKKTTERK